MFSALQVLGWTARADADLIRYLTHKLRDGILLASQYDGQFMILRPPTRTGSRLLTNVSDCSWTAAKQSLALGTEDVRSVIDSGNGLHLC